MKDRAMQRIVCFGLIAAAHAVIIVLLANVTVHRPQDDSRSSNLIFLRAVPVRTKPILAEPSGSEPDRQEENPRASPQLLPPSSLEAHSTSESTAPRTDWNAEAARAAATTVDKAISAETRKCDESDTPSSYLPKCTPPTHEFDWEPPRAGFSGGLPYMRIGENCVVGLGFFACGFGNKPARNGRLLEHMSDPERDRSSVPASPR